MDGYILFPAYVILLYAGLCGRFPRGESYEGFPFLCDGFPSAHPSSP